MLWPLVLAVKITLWVLLGFLFIAVVISPKMGWKRKRTLAWGTLLATLLFAPSCYGILAILDQYRFGIFAYPDFQAVNDMRVEGYLPEPATEITVEKQRQRYRAKFQISKHSLDQWFDQHWDRYGEQAAYPRTQVKQTSIDDYKTWFEGLDWPPLVDAIKYEGPAAANGAGFILWYSESAETAYQYTGYW